MLRIISFISWSDNVVQKRELYHNLLMNNLWFGKSFIELRWNLYGINVSLNIYNFALKELKLGLHDSDVDTLCIKIEAIALLMEIKSSKVYN